MFSEKQCSPLFPPTPNIEATDPTNRHDAKLGHTRRRHYKKEKKENRGKRESLNSSTSHIIIKPEFGPSLTLFGDSRVSHRPRHKSKLVWRSWPSLGTFFK